MVDIRRENRAGAAIGGILSWPGYSGSSICRLSRFDGFSVAFDFHAKCLKG
jgi:hypothetical protein